MFDQISSSITMDIGSLKVGSLHSLATVASKAKRWDNAAQFATEMAKKKVDQGIELSDSDDRLIENSFKGALGGRIRQLNLMRRSSRDLRPEGVSSDDKTDLEESFLNMCTRKLENEVMALCLIVLTLLECTLIPSVKSLNNQKECLYLKLTADFYKLMAEFASNADLRTQLQERCMNELQRQRIKFRDDNEFIEQQGLEEDESEDYRPLRDIRDQRKRLKRRPDMRASHKVKQSSELPIQHQSALASNIFQDQPSSAQQIQLDDSKQIQFVQNQMQLQSSIQSDDSSLNKQQQCEVAFLRRARSAYEAALELAQSSLDALNPVRTSLVKAYHGLMATQSRAAFEDAMTRVNAVSKAVLVNSFNTAVSSVSSSTAVMVPSFWNESVERNPNPIAELAACVSSDAPIGMDIEDEKNPN